MEKLKKMDRLTGADYPTLSEFTCRRREFMRHMALGAVAVGAGSALFSACLPDDDEGPTGGTPAPTPLEAPDTTGTPAGAHFKAVRLPLTGLGDARLEDGSRAAYRVTFLAREGDFADYCAANSKTCTHIVDELLAHHTRLNLTRNDGWLRACDRITDALEDHYFAAGGQAPAPLIDALNLEVHAWR